MVDILSFKKRGGVAVVDLHAPYNQLESVQIKDEVILIGDGRVKCGVHTIHGDYLVIEDGKWRVEYRDKFLEEYEEVKSYGSLDKKYYIEECKDGTLYSSDRPISVLKEVEVEGVSDHVYCPIMINNKWYRIKAKKGWMSI